MDELIGVFLEPILEILFEGVCEFFMLAIFGGFASFPRPGQSRIQPTLGHYLNADGER